MARSLLASVTEVSQSCGNFMSSKRKEARMKKLSLALLAVAALIATPAFAQQGKTDWDKIVLEDKAGNVMTSTGGDYQTAAIGKLLVVGENMMLSGDKSLAKVVYYDLDDNGNVLHRCVRDYRDPNTYIIDATCVPAAWAADRGAAGIITGAAVGVALLLNSQDDVPPGPISNGPRN